jgi:hypothetical protein
MVTVVVAQILLSGRYQVLNPKVVVAGQPPDARRSVVASRKKSSDNAHDSVSVHTPAGTGRNT